MSELLEDLEIIPATKSPHGYLASQLSENIHQRDDGTLIVVGCPIARTGWQSYSVKDLPKNAADLGVDVSNPNASIDLYRPESEVFHPEFLASLNGVPITDGHPPGGDFVDKDNYKKYACGHIQNVRKGPEPLEDGEWPVIADLIIASEPLISKVLNKSARDVSLGYDFGIRREGGKICQCNMVGNHNAVVPSGRAGEFVSIADAADPALTNQVSKAIVASEEILPVLTSSQVTYPPIKVNIKPKEKQPVAKNNWLRSLMGKHLIETARAADADPEKIMDLAESLQEEEPVAEDKKKGKDGELPEALKEHQFKSEDRKAKDDEEEEEMTDKRKAAHDALDALLDRTDGIEDKKKGKDADLEELKTLLDEFLSEEEKEPEHAEDADTNEEPDPTELDEVLSEDAEPCPDCGEAHDSEECPGEEEVESGEEELVGDEDPDSDDDQEDVEDRSKAKDRARAKDGASAVLKMLRPVVARTGDKAVQKAFNRALDSVKRSSRTSNGGYGKFAASASARDRAPRNPNPDRVRAGDGKNVDPISKMQAFYDNALKGGK